MSGARHKKGGVRGRRLNDAVSRVLRPTSTGRNSRALNRLRTARSRRPRHASGGRTTSTSSYTEASLASSRNRLRTPTSASHCALLKLRKGSACVTWTSNRAATCGAPPRRGRERTRVDAVHREDCAWTCTGSSASSAVVTSCTRSCPERTTDGASTPSRPLCAGRLPFGGRHGVVHGAAQPMRDHLLQADGPPARDEVARIRDQVVIETRDPGPRSGCPAPKSVTV